jgi:hypothetical protein
MKIMDTGAVTINMATKTKIMITLEMATATQRAAIKTMGMGMGMGTMSETTRLCMTGTRAIAETCRPVSQSGIDCRLDWNGNWNFGARCRPV